MGGVGEYVLAKETEDRPSQKPTVALTLGDPA
jgi:hypothetical protein